MRIQGIWNCPDEDQEVGAKHINEPKKPIDEDARDLVDLEDVSDTEHTNESTEHTDEANEDNPIEELLLKRLVYWTYYWIKCI